MASTNFPTNSVGFILEKLLVDRGYGLSHLEGFQIFFSSVEDLKRPQWWDNFLLNEDTVGLRHLPELALWFHFVYGQMFKLVRVSFTNWKAVDENGFSTELATKIMTTLSRSTVSASDFVQEVVGSQSTLPADFLNLAQSDNAFWLFFDSFVVLIAIYVSPKAAFGILRRLCATAAGLDGCWNDVVHLLHYFEPTVPLSKLSDGQKVTMLAKAVKKKGFQFRVGITRQDYERLLSEAKVKQANVKPEGGDHTLDCVEREEEKSMYETDDQGTQWSFVLSLESLVDNRKLLLDEVYVAKGFNESLKGKVNSIQSAIYMLVNVGKSFKQEEQIAGKKKAAKKQKIHIVESCDPKSMQSLRHAFNTVKGILRGKGKGTAIYGASLQQDLLDSEGWIKVRQLKRCVQAMATLQQSQPYSLESRPKWIEEVLEDHDLVGRYEIRSPDGMTEVRATHGHQGVAAELYQKILMDEDQRIEAKDSQQVWLYEKMSLEKILKEMEKLKKWKTAAHPAFRVLFPETVNSIQAYRKQFEDYQQLDQDFGNSENRLNQGCFLELDLSRLGKYYNLYSAPTGKAIYAFSRANINPPFYISLLCFTGRIWKLGENTLETVPQLEEYFSEGSVRVPTDPLAVRKNADRNSVEKAGEAKLKAAEQVFAEDEQIARKKIDDFLLQKVRTLIIEIRKSIFLHRKEKLKELKKWILEQNLLYIEDKSDPSVTRFEISKPDIVTRDECVALRDELQLPKNFDVDLLHRAVTINDDNTRNYEQLEFLGDAVLGCIIAMDKLIQVSFKATLKSAAEKEGKAELNFLRTNEKHRADNGVADSMGMTAQDSEKERAVVSLACSNKIITHLLPPILARRFCDRGLKVKADVVEALIGAVYDGNCGMDATRDMINRLYGRIPTILQSEMDNLTAEEKDDLRRAWDLCPYNQPGTDSTTFQCFMFGITRIVEVEADPRYTPGGDAHAAMIGFCRIQMKTFATHFTSGNVFCYRRIFPEDMLEIRNRIVCGAETEMTFVNELITDRMRLVIDFDGASVFSFNFYTYLTEWTEKKTNGHGRFLVATSSGKEKESCHIHFLDWIVPLSKYSELISDIEKYVWDRKRDFFERLQKAVSRSSLGGIQFIPISHCFLTGSSLYPGPFAFCNAQDLTKAFEASPGKLAQIIFSCMNFLSPSIAAQRFCVPSDQIMVGEVKESKTQLVYLQLVPRENSGAEPATMSESNSWQRWIIGQDIYENLNNILVHVDTPSDIKDKLNKSYLDAGLAKSKKLRMAFCDKCDMYKGRVNRPVYPFILSGKFDDFAHPINRLIHLPGLSLGQPLIPPNPFMENERKMWNAVSNASSSITSSVPAEETKNLLDDPEEVWDEAYAPTTLRKQFNSKEVRPFFLSCMDGVVLTSLREPLVRDVAGQPYSSWNAMKRESVSPDQKASSASSLFYPAWEQKVSTWLLLSDRIPRHFYSHDYRRSGEENPAAESLKKEYSMKTKLSLWFSMFKLTEEYVGPTVSINYTDEVEEMTKKRSSTAKTRCLLPTWIVREKENNRLAFLVAGEVVAKSKKGLASVDEAVMDLGCRLVKWLTPHFPVPVKVQEDPALSQSLLSCLTNQHIYVSALSNLPINWKLGSPCLGKRVNVVEEGSAPDVKSCISYITNKILVSRVGGCLIVVDDNEQPEACAFYSLLKNLKLFFRDVWLLSQCAEQFSFIKIHEYSKIFLLSKSNETTKTLESLARVYRSSALNECTIYHVYV